ncbi:putative zinc-binding metallopeptidase [Pelagicoccus sp. SDUM812002]|uniref:zinc-binding metallopeptidase family protein n=1 Tax=Pelagicoccus sp. SDUM812002 TaxID=3041266 RepID=UPI00280D86B4|nr:putative zinc-binding metallopeptidase [Pelagicoccus sp. SDUM812002]MDQ8186312.1 putative zinc-binding metallopeptidase [Pelagicoccus sp. SDUM812002]
MNNLYCEACGAKVFFQNSVCLSCSCSIAYDLESGRMVALSGESANAAFKPCRNQVEFNNCNWVIDANSEYEYCQSCRLTEIIPNLSEPANLKAWGKLEEAKRRLVYNLDRLGLRPVEKKEEDDSGLSFHFKADSKKKGVPRVLTGHASGVVTLNIVEADDVERERMRSAMNEPYRTLLGHFRHEVGHYYWDQLVAPNALDSFRELFGDESVSYADSLEAHYKNGPAANWRELHISAYAAAHPWEDWAETWAHYLHLMDSLGTAFYSKIRIEGERSEDPVFSYDDLDLKCFDSIIKHWPAVACMINSFNRSLGVSDAYPFFIPDRVVEKLRYVHDMIPQHRKD